MDFAVTAHAQRNTFENFVPPQLVIAIEKAGSKNVAHLLGCIDVMPINQQWIGFTTSDAGELGQQITFELAVTLTAMAQ